ncbi:DUF3800 domain-containing protein [candidate division KSB1 bacterium]|nr:DUF3800 domain-containing protein [candidate division KSB1 bacterium]
MNSNTHAGNLDYEHFIIYHDESGIYKKDRFFLTGLLLIKSEKKADIVHRLNKSRDEENYHREIHFTKIKGFLPKFHVAKNWLRSAERLIASGDMYFTCQIVDTHHRDFKHQHFSERFHAYNRLTAMAVTSGIAWHLKHKTAVSLHMVSDEKSRRAEGATITLSTDNFERYLPRRIQTDSSRASFPQRFHFNREVEILPSNGATPNHQLIQLTDVILGCINQCINPSTNRAKSALAEIVLCWIDDICKKPWEQTNGMHRKLNVFMFPFGDLARHLLLREHVESGRGQLSFF